MKKILKLAVACLAAAFQLSAFAAPIVDQENPDPVGGFCFTDDSRNCGQSFRQDHSNISGAGFFVDPWYGGGDGAVTLSIFSAYNGAGPTGLIASGTSLANVNSDSGWVDVFFAPAAVTVGSQYYLIIQSTNAIVAAFGGNNYADGTAVFNGSTTAYSSYDLTFRTYYDNKVAQVPEPGSFALLGLGIAGLAFARRKKRVH